MIEQILQGLYIAGMSHLLSSILSISASTKDTVLMWPGLIIALLIVLADELTDLS